MVGGEIECALVVEERKVAEDVRFNFLRLSFRVEYLQFGDDILNRAPAVATFEDFKARAAQPKRPLRHVQNARRLALFIQAATHGETRAALKVRLHRACFPGRIRLV